MAHAVDGRYPFLDHLLIDFCKHLPPRLKLFCLQEKFLLKKLAQAWLPDDICRRTKQPYRAPIHRSFFSPAPPDYVRELLSPEKIKSVGLFRETAVSRLLQKIEHGLPISETDDMAVAGILSTQLVHHLFVENYRLRGNIPAQNHLKRCFGAAFASGGMYHV